MKKRIIQSENNHVGKVTTWTERYRITTKKVDKVVLINLVKGLKVLLSA